MDLLLKYLCTADLFFGGLSSRAICNSENVKNGMPTGGYATFFR